MADKTISVLSELIEICRDGERGFRMAAENVRSSTLKNLFEANARQRARMVSELKSEIRQLGANPDDSGTVAGSLHRGWINLKSALTGGDEKGIVAECERGEDAAKAAYEKAVRAEDMLQETYLLLERQYQEVKKTHDSIRAIEQSYATVQ